MTYGLTESGFYAKRLPDIKVDLENDFRTVFGDIDVEASSVSGQIIGVSSRPLADLWELAELIYNGLSPASAEGVQLDNAVSLNGITRRGATHGQVDVVLYTEDTTSMPIIVPALTQVSVRGTDDVFELIAETQIDSGHGTGSTNAVVDCTFEILTASVGSTYQIDINGSLYSHTAPPGATVSSVASALATLINDSPKLQPVTATDHGDGTVRILADGYQAQTTFAIFITDDAPGIASELIEVGSPAVFRARVAGVIPVPIGTMTEIDTPVSGLDRTDNLEAGVPGFEIETDVELRQRRLESLQTGGGTTESIRAALLDDVPDVGACTIFENNTEVDYTPAGLPPHSYECVVTGGDPQAIGQKIWDTKPAGIQTHGDIDIIVQDTNGDNKHVFFSRPIEVYGHVYVEFNIYSGENYPGDTQAIAGIKNGILAAGNAFRIGQDLILDRWYAAIYNSGVQGIGNIALLRHAVTAAPGDSPVWVSTDIAVATTDIALFDLSRMTVIRV